MDEFYIGLDAHKENIVATVLDGTGTVREQAEFPARAPEIQAYLARWPGRRNVVLEACNVWEHVYDAAAAAAERVVLAHPYKTRVIAEASLKTDKVDSHALANLLRLDAVPAAYAPDRHIRDLRRLVRERHHVKRLETRVKNHTYGLLLQRGIRYERGVLNLKRKREALRLHRVPNVDRGLDRLRQLEASTAVLDEAVHTAYEASPEARLVRTVPGMGELTALTLVAELCPIARFPTAEKACSYVGLVPTTRQSGSVTHRGRLKQDASPFLKGILVEITWVHRLLAKNSDASKLGRRVARRRGAGKGNVAAARKLLKIAYAVLKRGTPYTPERPGRVAGAAAP